jgi:hypothetical protein
MITGAVLGLITGPFISAALYALHRTGRALTRTAHTLTRKARHGMVQR